ncbi:unnamed protein product [Lepidochelys olivacea]
MFPFRCRENKGHVIFGFESVFVGDLQSGEGGNPVTGVGGVNVSKRSGRVSIYLPLKPSVSLPGSGSGVLRQARRSSGRGRESRELPAAPGGRLRPADPPEEPREWKPFAEEEENQTTANSEGCCSAAVPAREEGWKEACLVQGRNKEHCNMQALNLT